MNANYLDLHTSETNHYFTPKVPAAQQCGRDLGANNGKCTMPRMKDGTVCVDCMLEMLESTS